MEIVHVPYGKVTSHIKALLPFLEKSEKWSHGRANADDILRLVLTERLHLCIIKDNDDVLGYFGLEVKQYPQCKMLVIQYCAMETGTLEKVQDDMVRTTEAIAKQLGCIGIEFIGRPGWRNVVTSNGYILQDVLYQKMIGEPK